LSERELAENNTKNLKRNTKFTTSYMLRNYFKVAWRNLTKHKIFSFINIFGLASGMTVCMLALIKIKDAYDYDTFHPNSARSYRIITRLDKKDGQHFLCASSPLPLADYLKENYKVIDKSTSVYFSTDEVTVENKKLSAKEAFVDADFYTIFGFKLISGSSAIQPQTVVLTTETAERFFGKQNPVGRTITIGSSTEFIVSGVLAKPPFPSHLKFDMLASASSIPLLKQNNSIEDWSDEAAAYTYVQLKEGASAKTLESLLKTVTKHANTIIAPSTGKRLAFDIQPLDKISPGTIPLYNITNEPIFPNLVVFALIGLSMLLLAFFNYINLTLSRSLDRAREVGIRKVAGALKYHLVIQFLSESVLVAILAFGLAYFQLKVISGLPTVNRIIGDASEDKMLWIYFGVFTILTGLFAGWIPAKVLSAFQPVRVLKGKFNTKLFGGVGLRKTLTVIQFSASLIAIVTLIVFYRQSEYMATADYGFARQQIINITIPANSYETVAAAMTATPGVEQVAGSSGIFGFTNFDNRFIKREKIGDSLMAAYFSVTPSFLSNMGIQLIAGENLPATSEKESHFVLINEEATRALQFKNPADAPGKVIWINDSTNYIIAGVVKDFHYASFLRRIQPLLLGTRPNEFKILNLKVAKGAEQAIILSLEKAWKKLYPNQPFEADWFDKQLYDQHLHKDDLIFIGLLTVMALSIACLGLLGMVIYTTKNRAKEVSIRRVMGANVSQVIFTISREFVTLLMISICIGLPAGFFAGKQFLQQYAYRIPVNVGILAASAAGLLLLGGITIGWQTYRTALANPAKSLRTE
jgi:putative ABC transport system permease protein